MRDRLIELCGNVIESCKSNLCADCEHNNIDYPNCMGVHFADYLLENGVIVPPCKVGDMVYEICLGKLSGQKTIKQSKVTAIKITDKLTITLDYTTNFYDTDIGRWLFVGNNAEEKAEQALKGVAEE